MSDVDKKEKDVKKAVSDDGATNLNAVMFRNRIEEMANMRGKRSYIAALYRLVSDFHDSVETLNKLHKVKVKDFVSFEIE